MAPKAIGMNSLHLEPVEPPHEAPFSLITEVWMRNPGDPLQDKTQGVYGDIGDYMTECAAVGVEKIVFDESYIVERKLDINQLIDNYFISIDKWNHKSDVAPYDIITVGDSEAVRDRPDSERELIPIWRAGDKFLYLHALAEEAEPGSRIILTRLPTAFTPAGRREMRRLSEFQREYPELIFHISGADSFRVCFGMDFRSMDFHPGLHAGDEVVFLPTGQRVFVDDLTMRHNRWLKFFHARKSDMRDRSKRVVYNLRSALWAGRYYYMFDEVVADGTQLPRSAKPLPGDKVHCDTCSLAEVCAVYRQGSVCTVSKDIRRLSQYFKTRDSESVLEGLGELLDVQLDRFEHGRALEEEHNKLSGEVTRIFNSLFKNGAELAKMLDPALQRPGIQINNVNGQVAIPGEQIKDAPQEITAKIFATLESKGYSRDEITLDMIKAVASGQHVPDRRRAINVQSEEQQ